jgi:hypothetical protein
MTEYFVHDRFSEAANDCSNAYQQWQKKYKMGTDLVPERQPGDLYRFKVE